VRAAYRARAERLTRILPRNVLRSVHEEARDHARQLARTPEFERSRNERKKLEMRLRISRPLCVSSACAYVADGRQG
jgi:hypothetical protein